MDNEELDNEEILDVPETSEETEDESVEEEVVVNASQDEASEDIDKLVEERANKLFEEKVEQRLIRDREKRDREHQKELSKYKQLENIMKAGLDVDSLDDAISKSNEFYKEQGVNIPEYQDVYDEEREKKFARFEAQEIIDMGRYEIQEEVERLSKIPYEQKSVYEKAMFETLGRKLTEIEDREKLEAQGVNVEMLDTKEFKDFREQFNSSTEISKIVDLYNKSKGVTVEKPKSPGSAKSTTTVTPIKTYYSPDDYDKLTEEDLKNPKIMEVVDRSRLDWYKGGK